jgi:DNA-binding PadR family transcriptional regulator
LGVEIVHHARYQYTDASKRKGRLINGQREDGQPIMPGTAVFLKGSQDHIHHVGVYVGHGICIEAKGTRWGVVTSELTHWDYWGELKVVDYTDAARLENEPAPEIPEQKSDVMYRVMVDNPGAWLNVRSGPGTTYPVLFRLEKGDVAEGLTVSEDGKWDQIRYGGRTGWASAEYLRILDEDQDEDPDQEPMRSQNEKIGEMIDMIRRMREEIDAFSETLEEMEKRAKEMEEWR